MDPIQRPGASAMTALWERVAESEPLVQSIFDSRKIPKDYAQGCLRRRAIPKNNTLRPETFAPAGLRSFGANPSLVAVADFNADSKPDLVVAGNSSTGSAWVLLGESDGTFQLAANFFVE